MSKIWIDCSGSVDEILALIILLDAPDYDVIAISCVRGKATTDHGIQNIARVLQVCKRRDIPLYRGAREPMTTPFPKINSRFTAREDAAESMFLSVKKNTGVDDLLNSEHHASIHLVEAAKEMEGTLGPFTNVAISCLLDPLFPLRLGKYVAVGGSKAGGDVTPNAEFNIYIDPEAAQLVLHKFPQAYLVTREIGQKYSWNVEEEWLEKAETPKAKLLEGILTVHEEMNAKTEWIDSTAIAAAIVTTPALVTITRTAKCQVELIGTVTRGQTVFDFEASSAEIIIPHTVAVVTDIDVIHFHQVLRGVIV